MDLRDRETKSAASAAGSFRLANLTPGAALAVAELTRAGVRVVAFSLGQPSLDEVFLALTGHPADPDPADPGSGDPGSAEQSDGLEEEHAL
jgi:hypothetical protein